MCSFIEVNDLTVDDLIGRITITTNNKREYADDDEYNKLPIYFESKDSWPKYTNLKCGYCTLEIRGIPLFVPRSITSDGRIEVGPSMCGFKCILKTIESFSKNEYNNVLSLVRILHRKMTGYELESITSDINRLELTKFNGTVTPKEFQKKIYDEHCNKKIYYELFANRGEANNFIEYFEEI